MTMKVLFVLVVVAGITISLVASDPCTFVDETRHASFDLSSMTRTTGQSDYRYTDTNGFVFDVNICAATRAECVQGTAVCQSNSIAGSVSCGAESTMEFVSLPSSLGTGVSISYNNGTKCGGGQVRQTIIHVLCNETATNAYISTVVEPSSCAYEITMMAAAACPLPLPSCQFVDESRGVTFDLSSLIRGDGESDYTYTDTTFNHTFWANICAPTRSQCEGDAAVCQSAFNDAHQTVYYSCGSLDTQTFHSLSPTIGLGVSVRYSSGDVCVVSQRKRNVTINVICDADADEAYITNVVEPPVPGCEYTMTMYSKAGCSTTPPQQQCIFTDPTTNITYDLNPMTRMGTQRDFALQNAIYNYTVNICAPIRSKCANSEGQAVCQFNHVKDETFGCGKASTQEFMPIPITYARGVQIKYTDGDQCKATGQPRTTIVKIVCDEQADPGFILSVQEVTPCAYEVTMLSKWACGL